MDENQISETPVTSEVRSARTISRTALMWVVLGLGLFAVAVSLVAWYPPISRVVSEAVSIKTLPSELREATFLSYSEESGSALYAVNGMKFASSPHPSTIVVGVPSHKHELLVTYEPSSSLYRIELGGVVLVESAERIMGASVSPDGRQVAYASQIKGKEGSKNPDDWHITMVYPATKKSLEYGIGFSPFFIDDSTLGRFSGTGIYSVQLKTGSSTELLHARFVQIVPVIQSPDRTLIAWSNVIVKSSFVYRVGSSFELVTKIPEYMSLIALGNTNLYRLQLQKQGTEVWEYSLTDAAFKKINMIPAHLHIIGISL